IKTQRPDISVGGSGAHFTLRSFTRRRELGYTRELNPFRQRQTIIHRPQLTEKINKLSTRTTKAHLRSEDVGQLSYLYYQSSRSSHLRLLEYQRRLWRSTCGRKQFDRLHHTALQYICRSPRSSQSFWKSKFCRHKPRKLACRLEHQYRCLGAYREGLG